MARPRRRLGNLPADSSSFIGRRQEQIEIAKKLAAARLVSLVGPGGVGKTRLALKSAGDLGRRFSHGAWLIELAELRDPLLVADAGLAALDLRAHVAAEPLAILLSYLKEKELLMVLDNCEHLLDGVASVVTQVMRAAPGVRLIATSREPLAVCGEHVFPVTPLDLPAPGQSESLPEMRRHEAVVLFEERAAAASGAFETTAASQSVVAQLCRRLDGLPLAIELAAVRTRNLEVDEILARLADRFDLLSGRRAATSRHQTLRTTFDWSNDLLTEEERRLLRRLSVFAGRFALEDVVGVCMESNASDETALGLLSSLVDKSLVVRTEVKGRGVYELHETIREYAGDKAREVAEDGIIQERCVSYYHARCVRSAADALHQLVEWLAWLNLEIDNIRWALSRCLKVGDFERGTELAIALEYFWITQAVTDGVRWLDEFSSGQPGAASLEARAGLLRGVLALVQADPVDGRLAVRKSAAAAQRAGLTSLLSEVQSVAAILEDTAGDHSAAEGLLARAANAAAEGSDYQATFMLLRARGFHGFATGDLDSVEAAATEGERISREAGDLYGLETMQMNLGGVALIRGNLPDARSWFTESLLIAQRIDDRAAQHYLLQGLGRCVAGTGQPRLAAQLLGAADAMRLAIGAGEGEPADPEVMRALEAPIAMLAAPRYQAAFEAGKSLGRDEAVRLALGEGSPVVRAEVSRSKAAPLGVREMEVAKLVAEGMSNRQIGTRLFISERTVDAHVRNILNKLGVDSRAQVAAWVASASVSTR